MKKSVLKAVSVTTLIAAMIVTMGTAAATTQVEDTKDKDKGTILNICQVLAICDPDIRG